MPVYAEIITQPDPQDAADLEILYPNDSVKLLASANSGKLIIYGGRFNGRILSAFTLTPIYGGDYQIAQLSVREVTRRRGVARQLIIQAMKQLPDDLQSISADLRGAPELINLFAELGFSANNRLWCWQRNT
ncbi:acetyl-CoA sensor PanZ family protein [Zhongshania aliphaticivorans]|uniref:acetyl-CoA sensor PanZ family protein n=1 Tax=Zhongshania aliphaticivorans TaxID=1470434 RepID=UPI0012E66F79|nr:acetyl-CoA sensor PanZ family protein [Zhongshania aliphaticivorans]CAA0112458.1 PanD regulatory factor [Zhongshania aliphaticivorans]